MKKRKEEQSLFHEKIFFQWIFLEHFYTSPPAVLIRVGMGKWGVYRSHFVRLPVCSFVHVSDRVRSVSSEPLNHCKKKNQTWYGRVLS